MAVPEVCVRPAPAPRPVAAGPPFSLRSRVGLDAANFFLAEIVGVVLPFVAKYLGDHHWREDGVGVALSIAGLGVFLVQTPAGFIIDRIKRRRMLLAGSSLVLGLCYGAIPLLPAFWWVIDLLLFTAGAAQAFFAPLLGALALGLAGHAALNRVMGENQGWNHAGNIAAALLGMALVAWLGGPAVFYTVAAVSTLAAGSVFLVRRRELDEDAASGDGGRPVGFLDLLRDRRILILFIATALFHLANAPVMPFVGLYVKELGGSDVQLMAVVLVAQTVMVPVALASGRLADRWGRKPVFAVGFLALPVRIFLYSLTRNPWVLVALQSLDGIGAGIYGVVIVSMCADLTAGKGRFNALQGLIATALSVGGVVGPLGAGYLARRFGFAPMFYVFSAIAAAAAVVFIGFMPETRRAAA